MSEELMMRRHCQAANYRYGQQPSEGIGYQWRTVCREARLDGWCRWSEELAGQVRRQRK